MRFVKPLLGLALLGGLVSLTDVRVLIDHFQKADLTLFGAALLLAIVANLICVKRWQLVAKDLGLSAPYGFLVSAYAQGISANSVLPGGIVGGDAWRSLAIAKQAAGGSNTQGVLSVLLDRVSGFWGLTWLSLTAGLVAVFIGQSTGGANQGWFDSALGQIYLLALLAIALAPLVGRLVHMSWLKHLEADHHGDGIGKGLQAVIQVINALPILRRTLVLSVVVQILSVTVLWLCLASVGMQVSWWLLTALCGGVFLSGILPAALGGFGARELGAVAFMTPFGFSKEGVLAGSVLFGLTATIQGLLGLWFWFRSKTD
jgi:uncharacterized membrane protein YbhN (UPF0104 family)